MPGPISHLIIQQRLPGALENLGGDPGRQLAATLRRDPCSPYTAFGAQGADFLFFSLKEYEGPADELFNTVFDVYDALRPLIDFYDHSLAPLVEQIEEAVIESLDDVFDGAVSAMQATIDQLMTTLTTAGAAVFVDNVDLFHPLKPRVQMGRNEDHWYWTDMLHTRRPGAFVSNLWKLAGRDEDLQRYVIGYGSHVGTDVAFHPYVNAVVGGPYRMHWHRHHLVENWIDAHVRQSHGDLPSTVRCLDLTPEDGHRADSIAASHYARLCTFADGVLPAKLAGMFRDAMVETYGDMTHHPEFLSGDDIDTAYRLWLAWLEQATSIGDLMEPSPVPPPGGHTESLVNDFVAHAPSLPSHPVGGFDLFGILEALFDYAKWAFDAVVHAVDWLGGNFHNIVLLPATEALQFVKWVLYGIRKGLWEVYDKARFRLVLEGLLYPSPRDLAVYPWSMAFLQPSTAHLAGGPPADFHRYPRRETNHALFGTSWHHLAYPQTSPEYPLTAPAPLPFERATPDDVLTGTFAYNHYAEHHHTTTAPYGPDTTATHHVNTTSWDSPQFGSALSFTAHLLSRGLDRIPDYSLDGDRGYAWKAWKAANPAGIETANPLDTAYHDEGAGAQP